MREPRTIDADALKPRKVGSKEYEDIYKRQETYMKEHGLYLENKKEQQERMQLYYILEQFYEKA